VVAPYHAFPAKEPAKGKMLAQPAAANRQRTPHPPSSGHHRTVRWAVSLGFAVLMRCIGEAPGRLGDLIQTAAACLLEPHSKIVTSVHP
jgi:hypothetical protein